MEVQLKEVRLTDNFPRLSTAERIAVLGAVALSPFWFLTLFGVNFGPSDALLLVAFVSYFVRTRTLPVIPSCVMVVGVSMFLTAGLVAVLISPVPVEGLLDYLQYLYIFLVVLPIAFVAFSDERTRVCAFLTLLAVLNALMLTTVTVGVLAGGFDKLTLWYGNQNQLYWLVASAFVLDICLAVSESLARRWRIGGLLLATVALAVVVLGLTLTAILIVGGSAWLIVSWSIAQDNVLKRRYGRPFAVASFIGTLGGIAFVALNWQFVSTQGSLYARIPQYTAALSAAVGSFPLGTGLASERVVLTSVRESNRVVHNYFLAYFLQIGIIGALGFTLILVAWLREVFLVAHASGRRAFEFAFVAIFATYIVVILLQPVPVRRYWWLVFALTWGAYQPGHVSAFPPHRSFSS